MDEKTKHRFSRRQPTWLPSCSRVPASFAPSARDGPLRLGSGWTIEDLDKPQVIIESTFGDSHPGSAGLFELVEEVRAGVAEAGGHGARYFCTDICDGEAQGHDGINYSLPSRDMIANMIEIHAKPPRSMPASLSPAAIRACLRTSWPWAASTSPPSSLPAVSWMPVPIC